MWVNVEQELGRLLSSKVFPALRGIPAYDKLLTPTGQPDPAACQIAARDIVNSTDLKSGIREFGSREIPTVREWIKPLCRAVSPRNNPNGAWWFDEELVRRWSQKYPQQGRLNLHLLKASFVPVRVAMRAHRQVSEWSGLIVLRSAQEEEEPQ